MTNEKIAIRINSIGKKYRLGGQLEPYTTLRDAIITSLKKPFKPALSNGGFWALKNISFNVTEGEVIGIIGRNGAGKSTLLKILSKITTPTEGTVEIRGRVGSLLEVGTGFHPEMTGRENIFLNGSILGMKKGEIEQKFDEIVKFSEIEKFLDTPVKRYSSGMYVRLAFAVAAHLETDVLLVDEVLAVGDTGFQKKCLGKMGDIAKEGRTVFFVSHNMSAVASLCQRGILLSEGQIIMDGNAKDVTAQYLSLLYEKIDNSSNLLSCERFGNGKAKFVDVRITPVDNEYNIQDVLQVGQNLEISLNIVAYEKIIDVNVATIIYDLAGYRIIDANIAIKNTSLSLNQGQSAQVTFLLQNVLLRPGTYVLGLWMGRANIEDIDGITYSKQFIVEIDPHTVCSQYQFPGIYLCNYSHSITVNRK